MVSDRETEIAESMADKVDTDQYDPDNMLFSVSHSVDYPSSSNLV